MSVITFASLCTAVAAALVTAETSEGVATVQAFNELTESIPQTPTLQVYFKDSTTDDTGIHQAAFKAGVRITRLDIMIDCYARTRSHIGEDMAAQIEIIDAVDALLNQQITAPFFGGAKALHWVWKKAVLTSAEAEYAGAECTLTLWIF